VLEGIANNITSVKKIYKSREKIKREDGGRGDRYFNYWKRIDCLVLGILRLQKEIGGLHGEIGELRGEIDELHSEMNGLRNEVNELRSGMDELCGEIGRLHSEVDELRGEIRRLDTRMDEMSR